ncbi:MAG: DCC1-like thiol-disulfide oxidoreductase family protein [Lacunisphaera sp.]
MVRLLLRTDRRGRLKFAALQSAPAQEYLRGRKLSTTDFDSLVFVPDWNAPGQKAPLLRTDGALAAAAEVGGGWRLVAGLRVLPAWSRDPFYKLVARLRYALFGEYCGEPLAESEWGERFLDRM